MWVNDRLCSHLSLFPPYLSYCTDLQRQLIAFHCFSFNGWQIALKPNNQPVLTVNVSECINSTRCFIKLLHREVSCLFYIIFSIQNLYMNECHVFETAVNVWLDQNRAVSLGLTVLHCRLMHYKKLMQFISGQFNYLRELRWWKEFISCMVMKGTQKKDCWRGPAMSAVLSCSQIPGYSCNVCAMWEPLFTCR